MIRFLIIKIIIMDIVPHVTTVHVVVIPKVAPEIVHNLPTPKSQLRVLLQHLAKQPLPQLQQRLVLPHLVKRLATLAHLFAEQDVVYLFVQLSLPSLH